MVMVRLMADRALQKRSFTWYSADWYWLSLILAHQLHGGPALGGVPAGPHLLRCKTARLDAGRNAGGARLRAFLLYVVTQRPIFDFRIGTENGAWPANCLGGILVGVT
jgi:hypothetical protein